MYCNVWWRVGAYGASKGVARRVIVEQHTTEERRKNNMKSTQTTGEGIVDRLTGALSAMRKERDELHRQKDIAHERLKLVREDRSAVEKVVLSMRKELEQLMIDTSGQGRKTENESIEKLVTEVERLAKEATFQHQELVSKKELLSQMENRISQDQMARAAQLQKTMTELRRKREKTSEDMKQETLVALDETLRVDAFRRAFKNDESLLERLPRLIQTKVSELEKESAGLSEQCESLQKKINGYNHRFGEMDPKSNDAMDQ